MAEIKLKLCPFCGNSVYVDYSYYFRDYIIFCNDCDMIFTLDDCNASEENVCEAWNRRAAMLDMSERTYERRCESCIHFVPYPESEEFDICKIQGSTYEIYRELPYDKCTAYEHNANVAAEIFKALNHDAVNHPLHYTAGSIECIEALKAATTRLRGIEAVCTANAIKCLCRWKDKNGAEDIRKAIGYCERLLKEIGDEQT